MITAAQCRTHAANYETVWRGQPGWHPVNNMAVEWRKAAAAIEQLQGKRRDPAIPHHMNKDDGSPCIKCGASDTATLILGCWDI